MKRLVIALLLTTGCGTPGFIKARAVEGPLFRVAERHDKYVREDDSLTELQKRANLRDTALLRKVIKEANRAASGEE